MNRRSFLKTIAAGFAVLQTPLLFAKAPTLLRVDVIVEFPYHHPLNGMWHYRTSRYRMLPYTIVQQAEWCYDLNTQTMVKDRYGNKGLIKELLDQEIYDGTFDDAEYRLLPHELLLRHKLVLPV